MTLTKIQKTWIEESIRDIMWDWTHPAGEDAHLYMSDDEYIQQAVDYFNKLNEDHDLVYEDWGDDFKELESAFHLEFGFNADHGVVFDMFMVVLAEQCGCM